MRHPFRAHRGATGLLLLLVATLFGSAGPQVEISDRIVDVPAPYDAGESRNAGFARTSRYLTMRDGVRIAIDVYLPADLGAGERLPTILNQTRYWRSTALRWPFSLWLGGPGEMVEDFVGHGYAWVAVDARGSGASFGTRPYPWSPDERKDGAEIVDWIVAQSWSNGNVGTFGTSYNGTTAEFLAINQHPAVKATAPRFSLFDAYTDIAFPGGVRLGWFSEQWGIFNRSLDENRVPDQLPLIARLAANGVRPVDGDLGPALLEAAVRDHAENWDVHGTSLDTTYRDDDNADGNTLALFSPHRFAEELDASGAAVYSWSGWFDGGYQHAAIKRHLTLEGRRNKLIIGPWDHGGRHQVRAGRSVPTDFDHAGELLKFFDRYLRDADTGIENDAPVHYYTLVEGRWKASHTWPPDSQTLRLYLRGNGALSSDAPSGEDGADRYTVDPSHRTGEETRWNSLMGLPVNYADRAAEDAKLLVYDSDPLPADLEVTGHPIATLHVTSSADDGAFFVYLEDVGPDGSVSHVTEGVLRALHRKISTDEPEAVTPAPNHSFRRADGRPLVPGEAAELVFDLLPTSYLFRAGHRVRVALAGADLDHFTPVPEGDPPTWSVHRDAARPSHVALPVIARTPVPRAAAPRSQTSP